jgi:hypothetical protein
MPCTSRLRPDVALHGYVTPRCADILSKGISSGFGDSLVLFAAPAADADGAHYLAGTL